MTNPPVRTPYCHKIRYGITGAPILTENEMDGSHSPGVGVSPTLIELVFSPARDGKPARVDASVTGDWTRFGEPEGFGGQVTTHFKSGPDGWPAWLAEEARLHDPAAETEQLREVTPLSTDRIWQVQVQRRNGSWIDHSPATIHGSEAQADYEEAVASSGHLWSYRLVCSDRTHTIAAQHDRPEGA
jgi:hypothetical protein